MGVGIFFVDVFGLLIVALAVFNYRIRKKHSGMSVMNKGGKIVHLVRLFLSRLAASANTAAKRLGVLAVATALLLILGTFVDYLFRSNFLPWQNDRLYWGCYYCEMGFDQYHRYHLVSEIVVFLMIFGVVFWSGCSDRIYRWVKTGK